MFSTMWIWYIASLTNVLYTLQLNDLQNVPHKRFKREENTIKTTEISTEDLQNYSYIVRVKIVQWMNSRKKSKTTVMCMGTMLNPNLVLTTDYCVRNAVSITVFLPDSSELKANIILISIANIAVKPGERKTFPNPLFYGDRVSTHHKWYSIHSKSDKTQATMNMAMVYLNRSLDEIRLTNLTVYPAIVANPSHFVDRNRSIDVFGTLDLTDNNTIGKLVKFRFQVYPCESDAIFANSICVDPELYKKAILDADQGAPVMLSTDDGDENNNVTSSSLIAMVNTPKSDGRLIYLWPYAGWIRSVLEELSTFESSLPCNTEIDNDVSNSQLPIDSYYDLAESDKNSKTINSCSRAALTAVVPAVSPPVAFSSAIVTVVVVVTAAVAAR